MKLLKATKKIPIVIGPTHQMQYLCAEFREIGCQNIFYKNSYSQAIELDVKYFEDIYYCAIYELYLTFGKEIEI